jgi:hypothetical protein
MKAVRILRRLARIPRLPHKFYFHRNRGNCWHKFLEIFSYSLYSFGTEIEGSTTQFFGLNFQGDGTIFKVLILL